MSTKPMKKSINKSYKILFFLLIPIVLFFFLPDFTSYPKSLDPIFRKAGNNQLELKKAIRHYSWFASDSLKRKAIIFLIENMDVHFSNQSIQWEKFQVELDSLFKKKTDPAQLNPLFDSIYKKHDWSDVRYISDLQAVNAKFLIQNVDEAFEAWQSPYAKHLSFEDFCEYILPYRVGEEPLSDWRKEFNNHLIPQLFSRIRAKKNQPYVPPVLITVPFRTLEGPSVNWVNEFANKLNRDPLSLIDEDNLITAKDICDALKTGPGSLRFMPGEMLDFNTHLLSILISGTCRDYSLQGQLAARMLGVPVAMECTPQWATRSCGHEWNALIDEKNKPLAFGFGDYVVLGKHIEIVPDRIPAKIYRVTFAKQLTSLAHISGKEEIPLKLASPCLKDVTKNYYQTIDVPIKLLSLPPNEHKFVYLSVFDNINWVPVAWSKINNGDVLFKNLNKNIACLPSYYHDNKVLPAAYPIILHRNGTITTLKPNLQKRKTVVLNRKYQTRMSAWLGPTMIGGRFQVSNDSNFMHPVDIHVIKDTAEAYFKIVKINLKRRYKYFRYLLPNNPNGGLSEIELCPPGSFTRLAGRAFGNNHPLGDRKYANAFDGDVLTQYQAKEPEGSWVGLVFDKPERIGRIAYLRRDDGNCICNGELYELFYWDNKWISLGQQTGSNVTYRLTYRNVPTNALLLLRNLTKGIEERIFTYENGKQVWW